MNTRTDSKAEVLCGINMRVALLLCIMSFPVSLGCGNGSSVASSSPALRGVDPQLVTLLGKLHFVSDLAAGQKLAAEQGKPCLLFFTADWCTFCHRMENTAFVSNDVAKLAENFVCIRIDADNEQKVCKEFGISGFPTIQFLSAKGQVLHRLVGGQSAPALAQGMQAALERVAWLNEAGTQTR